MNPQFEDETPVNPFDFWEGANFKLKIRQVEGYRNYDKSEFDNPSALSKNDDELEVVYNKLYSLKAFLADDCFKSYDELEAKMNRVLGLDTHSNRRDVEAPTKSRMTINDDEDDAPWNDKKSSSRSTLPEPPSYGQANDEEDDLDTDYFKRLAED